MKISVGQLLRATLMLLFMLMAMAGAATAGQFEVGEAAYARGDYTTALRLFRPLANQGNASAQLRLGFMYYSGQGVPQNYAEAMKWSRLAADQGDPDAQLNVGIMYAKGYGVPRDYAEAMKWLRLAADQGDSDAQLNVGIMYAKGYGVPQDYAEAMKWYRLSADQGNAEAQDHYAVLYRNGYRVGHGQPLANNSHAEDTVSVASPNTSEVETLLIASVEKARAAFAAGANDMAKGAARPARAKEICAILKNQRLVSDWVGKVETLSSNSDGLGVLSIQIAEGVSIKTWSNAISDVGDQTLIDPESAVFKRAIALKVGQRVIFGGQFIPSSTDCIREGSLTLAGSLTKPEFIFRFSNIAAAPE
jgi:uncharacterized protein